VIATLRERVARIERSRPLGETERTSSRIPAHGGATYVLQREHPAPWTSGLSEIDARLGPGGLDEAACHEIKPDSPGAGPRAAAIAFALHLANRRLQQLHHPLRQRMRSAQLGLSHEMNHEAGFSATRPLPILWCTTQRATGESGHLYAPGLAAAGLDPARLILVEARRAEDVLWALEQGLTSGAIALAVGCLESVDLTPARRLSLAALSGRTPALLLTLAQSAPAGAMATRWRIAPAPSAPHPLDPRAPGQPRYAITLERCRAQSAAGQQRLLMTWPQDQSSPTSAEPCDDTHRVPVAAVLADRPATAARSIRRAG
jgi:protein ImuA